MSGFAYGWLNVVLRWCLRMRANFNWITTRHILYIDVSSFLLSVDEPQFFQSVILLNVDSFFLLFRKTLFPVVLQTLLPVVFLVLKLLWENTLWAWISLLFWSRIVVASFCILLASSFSSFFSVSKSLILGCKLSTISWSLLIEVFQIFADFSDSIFMVWSSSMKNAFISIILSHSSASNESSLELNDELITIWMKRRRCAGSYK